MDIELSDGTFQRLQELAEPLVDTVEDVILRLLDSYGGNGEMKSRSSTPPIRPRLLTTPARSELRGFQRELWELVILKMPTEGFSLRDVYARQEPLVELRPHVKEMEASIRGTLEKLRDKGYIEFIDNRGRYRRRR